MSEYVDDTGFLESVIKIEPEEFETIEQKAAADVLKSNISDRIEPPKLGDIGPTGFDFFNSGGIRRDSVKSLSRKGNEEIRSDKPHSCCICQKVVSCRQTLREHLENCHFQTNQMSCDLCPKAFFTRVAVIKHMRTAHGGEKFGCDKCDYKTARKDHLENHKLTHAAKTECPICSKQVTSLKNHIRDHKTKVSCQICQKLILPRNMKKHKKTHALQKCGDCGDTFHSSEDLRRHTLRSHFKGNLHECHCGAVFGSNNSLWKHQQSHKGKKETCDVCEKQFSSKTNLKYHREKQHGSSSPPKEKVKVLNTSGPFICDKCGTKLSSRGSFLIHISIHRSAKFFCDLCPRSFHQKCYLARHMMRDHLKLRPFQCDICKHKVFTRRDFDTHKLRHGSKEKCRVCHKRVTNMAVHLRTHSNKVKCQICSKMFSKNNLRKHLKIHSKTR